MRLIDLHVEGGFLDGLAISFQPDLNVVIGGRGVGKTAIVELIRYCLGVRNLDAELSPDSYDHAVGVLQDGLATLTIEAGGETLAISRTAEQLPTPTVFDNSPLILSQREVETLARTPKGRLSLIDSFFVVPRDAGKAAQAQIKALSVEIRDLCGQIDELHEQLDRREETLSALAKLKKDQTALATNTDARTLRLARIDSLQQQLNGIAQEEHTLVQVLEQLRRWQEALPRNYRVQATLPTWPFENDPIFGIRIAVAEDVELLQQIAGRADGYVAEVNAYRKNIQVRKAPLEEQLRKLRLEMESEQAGSGQLAREISRLEEAVARYSAIEESLKGKLEQAYAAQQRRLSFIAELGERREALADRRQKVVDELNFSLSPKIKVHLRHLADVSAYETSIRDALRGSNLRYGELAPIIAREISPIELCEITFERSVRRLAELLRINEDRAGRLLEAIRDCRLEEILTAAISDEVDFCLLDGAAYKAVDALSIGQRCTVVLSIVLENMNVVLVVDQPEDHLDNEFVAETLIKAIRGRSIFAQTLICTHNANIPVLGEASQVIHLDSNGHRGFVKCAGGLDNTQVVEAVLSVMEGGEKAFTSRAKFYETAL